MTPLSIAMPYWNRRAELLRALLAYERVYPYPEWNLEFSIANDGSTGSHSPVTACRNFVATVIALPPKTCALNPCVPINVAVRACTRDVIVLTNPEIEHRTPVLARMLEQLTRESDYVTASCFDVTTGQWLAGPLTKYGAEGREPAPPGTHFHFCAMFHRSLFERAGGFDEAYRNVQGCDDADWLWRLRAAGAVFKHVDEPVYHHRTPHAWTGTPAQGAALLRAKWGYLPEFEAQIMGR